MRKFIITYSIQGTVTIPGDPELEEEAESLVEQLEESRAPVWLEEMIKENIDLDTVRVEDLELQQSDGLDPEEPLNFDF